MTEKLSGSPTDTHECTDSLGFSFTPSYLPRGHSEHVDLSGADEELVSLSASLPLGLADLCGIILAGGEGQRLRPLIHRTTGKYLPKQYVNFIGRRSMLEHTFARAEKLIAANRIFAVINRNHLEFPEVKRQIAGRPESSLVTQPQNKETGPGVLLALMQVYKRFPAATVVLFPSDQFILEEDVFMAHVYLAYRGVARDSSRIVLLGMSPTEADPGYGYVVPGQSIEASPNAPRRIEFFVEKPAIELSRKIIRRGALWNTLVIIARCKTLLDLIECTAPDLYRRFDPLLESNGAAEEQAVLERVYRSLSPMNFSTGILERLPTARQRQVALVLPVTGVFWSDWGTEDRVRETVCKLGYQHKVHAELREQASEAIA